MRPRIGLTASIDHPNPTRALYKGKALLFFEESMAHFVMRAGGEVVLIPRPVDDLSMADIVDTLDGLLLTGGVDVAPESYGEQAFDARWPGDKLRDAYELEVINACRAKRLPILGICRGVQILNVAFGGTLYQDLESQVPDAKVHRNWDLYDNLNHEIDLKPGSFLGQLYDVERGRIISVHHQGIKDVAPHFRVEALSLPDGIVEAIWAEQSIGQWVLGVQWHPEFQKKTDVEFLDPALLGRAFIEAARTRSV
jgi:putative glutamine amidotransferase